MQERIQSIERVTVRRILRGLISFLLGVLVGATFTELVANWSAGYGMVNLHRVLVYLVPSVSSLTAYRIAVPRMRPSRKGVLIISVVTLAMATIVTFRLVLFISFVAGIAGAG